MLFKRTVRRSSKRILAPNRLSLKTKTRLQRILPKMVEAFKAQKKRRKSLMGL